MATATAAVKAVKAPSPTGDIVARWVVLVFAASLLAIAVLLVYELFIGSAPAREKLGLWGFLFSSKWNPVTEDFGALPFVYGTVVTSVVALLISVPFGLGAAIFLSELAPAGVSNALTFVI
jgi:phosphate transport system permease protein